MSKKAFRVEGDFQMGRIRQHFVVEVIGDDEAAAKEACYADLGSRHSVPRRLIDIQAVKDIPTDEASPILQKRLRG